MSISRKKSHCPKCAGIEKFIKNDKMKFYICSICGYMNDFKGIEKGSGQKEE